MRNLLTVSIAMLLGHAITVSGAENKPVLNDEMDNINYAIGHQIGTDFKRQNVDLDRQSLQQGINDGYVGSEPLLEKREMGKMLSDLKKVITKDMENEAIARMQTRHTAIMQKKKIGNEFLEANKNKAGVITTDSGLQYKVIKEGTGQSPTSSDNVKIHYKALRLSGDDYRTRHVNGKEFGNTYKDNKPGLFNLKEAIPGLAEALQMMQPGSKWEIYLPPELAYGRRGPLAHETIIMEVELLETVSQ